MLYERRIQCEKFTKDYPQTDDHGSEEAFFFALKHLFFSSVSQIMEMASHFHASPLIKMKKWGSALIFNLVHICISHFFSVLLLLLALCYISPVARETKGKERKKNAIIFHSHERTTNDDCSKVAFCLWDNCTQLYSNDSNMTKIKQNCSLPEWKCIYGLTECEEHVERFTNCFFSSEKKNGVTTKSM